MRKPWLQPLDAIGEPTEILRVRSSWRSPPPVNVRKRTGAALSPSIIPPAVLIVEDEWLLRMELSDALTEIGYSVTESFSAEDAIARLNQGETFDLLVTDIRLKGALTGWDVAVVWRDLGARLPVIYVSANSPDDPRRVAGSVFLGKPVVLHKFLAACSELLRTA